MSSNTDSDFVEVDNAADFETPDMKFFPVYNVVPDLADTEDMSRDFRIDDLKRVIVGKPTVDEKPIVVAGTSKQGIEIKINLDGAKAIDDDLFQDIFKQESDIFIVDSEDEEDVARDVVIENKLKIAESKNKSVEQPEESKNKSFENPKVLDILEDLKKQRLAIASIDLNNILSDDILPKTEEFDIKDVLKTSTDNEPITVSENEDDSFESDASAATVVDEEWKTLDLKKVQDDEKVTEEKKDHSDDVIFIDDDENDGIKNDDKQECEIGFTTPTKLKEIQATTPRSKNSVKYAPIFTERTPTPKTVLKSPNTPKPSTSKSISRPSSVISVSESPVQLSIPTELVESKSKPHNDNSLNPKNLMAEFQAAAAENLKTTHSTQELQDYASALNVEKFDLERERNKQDRMGTSITQQMSEECKELLKLFGVPYIVAPMEAEAQCAFLNYINLTDGTITDDSDIWLFGGQTVYKNFFNLKKNVMEFRMENIEKLYKIDRHKMIQLALLVGSDYTTGVTEFIFYFNATFLLV